MNNEKNSSTAQIAEDTAPPTQAAEKKKAHEPLFHIVKRAHLPIKQSLTIRIVAILLALVFAGLFTLILLGENPFTAYKTMFLGVFGANTLVSLRSTAILLCIALALTPAFKMRFWNTGAEGQVLMGVFASAACMFYLQELPPALLVICMLIASLVAGAIWGIIPAIFKAYFGTNETLFTLMMNSVASCIVLFFMKQWHPNGKPGAETLDPTDKIDSIFGSNYWIIILIVLIVTAIMYIYLRFSKHGYEISVVGESENTAKYIGINVKSVIIRTMMISGLIAGLAGFLIIAPSQSIASTSVGGQGFTAIMVAWLAKFNPLIMIITAFLFIFVSVGGQEISSTLGYEAAYSDILIGILLFFIIGCEFFISYELIPGTVMKNLFEKIKAPFVKLFAKKSDAKKEDNE